MLKFWAISLVNLPVSLDECPHMRLQTNHHLIIPDLCILFNCRACKQVLTNGTSASMVQVSTVSDQGERTVLDFASVMPGLGQSVVLALRVETQQIGAYSVCIELQSMLLDYINCVVPQSMNDIGHPQQFCNVSDCTTDKQLMSTTVYFGDISHAEITLQALGILDSGRCAGDRLWWRAGRWGWHQDVVYLHNSAGVIRCKGDSTSITVRTRVHRITIITITTSITVRIFVPYSYSTTTPNRNHLHHPSHNLSDLLRMSVPDHWLHLFHQHCLEEGFKRDALGQAVGVQGLEGGQLAKFVSGGWCGLEDGQGVEERAGGQAEHGGEGERRVGVQAGMEEQQWEQNLVHARTPQVQPDSPAGLSVVEHRLQPVPYLNHNIASIITMFTFKQPQHPRLAPVPDIREPAPLHPLPPLPLTQGAFEPIPEGELERWGRARAEGEGLRRERDQAISRCRELEASNEELRGKYEGLLARYKEGEELYRQIEVENAQLYHELEALKTKKQKISIGLKKKQTPVVRINIPSARTLAQDSEKQSLYRQLRAASEQLLQIRKDFEKYRQKAQSQQQYMAKSVEQAASQRDILRNEVNLLRDEVKLARQENVRLKASVIGAKNRSPQQNQLQKLRQQLQSLEKVHKSCDILLASKQTQIQSLKLDIRRLSQPKQGTGQKNDLHKSYLYQHETNTKQFSQGRSYLPASPPLKRELDYNPQAQDQLYVGVLEQHLELSVREMQSIDDFVKKLVRDFTARIEELRSEAQWANKKVQHQKFELDKVYELLRDKKQELENCYRDMRSSKNKSTPSKDSLMQESYMKSILKDRRDFSA